MKMDFILSSTTDYAMKLCLLDLLKKAEKDKLGSYIVVAPETKTLEAERILLSASKSHAFANIYIYSFNRLLKRVQIKPIYPLNKEAGVMIVRNIIMAISGDLVCYKKTAGTVGFAENIYETLQQLKSSGISPIELSEAAKKCNTALKIKLEDIALIYDAYENYLGEELIDPSDKLTMLEKQVELSDKIKSSHIAVVGFDALTASACSVIKSFVKNALSVTVSASFMHESKKNAHISDNEVFEHLKQVADSLNIKYEPKFIEKPLAGDFKHIYENLYAYPHGKLKTKGNIFMFGCPSEDIECRRVASLIKADVLNKKCRFKDNYVYLASESIKDSVVQAFEEFSVPYFVSEPYQFETHQLFVFIKLLFMLIRKNLDSEDVISFARNALLELDSDVVDHFENYVLKYGINHAKFLKPFTYGEGEFLQVSEYVRQKIYEVVGKFSAVYNENMRAGEVCEALLAFFEEFKIEEKLEKLKKSQEELGEIRASLATSQSLSKAKEVLSMLSQFLGCQKMKLDDFYTLFISGLEAADISLLPSSIDCVNIVTQPDGIFEVRNLYVLGATDGQFPKREQDLGLIQDAEIISLEGLSEKKIEPTIRTINRRERYKVFELLTLPLDKLTISFSQISSSGEETMMSSIMQSLSSLFLDEEGEEIGINKVFSPFVEEPQDYSGKKLAISLGSNFVATMYLSESLKKYRDGYNLEAGTHNIHSLYKALEPEFDDGTRKAFEFINEEERKEEIKNAKNLFFPKSVTSISQLERYFACPFKHFVNYGLKLKDREMASMRALDVGDILHEVCEKFVNHYLKHKDVDPTKFAKNVLKNILKNEKYSEDENRVLIKILESETERLLIALYDELNASLFVPTKIESWFGKDGAYKGIVLNEEENIELVGKIDRIDENEHFYRLIDYKTGRIESSPEDIYYGRKLQLALYLSALGNLKKQPAGVLYFPIRNEFAKTKQGALEAYKMKGFILNNEDAILNMDKTLSLDNPKSRFIFPEIRREKTLLKNGIIEFKQNNGLLTDEQMQSIASYARAVASKAVDEILSGHYAPSPFKKNGGLTCDFCEFRNVCGIVSSDYQSVREPHIKNTKDFYLGGKIWQKT